VVQLLHADAVHLGGLSVLVHKVAVVVLHSCHVAQRLGVIAFHLQEKIKMSALSLFLRHTKP